MTVDSPRMAWPFPSRDDDPWFDAFESFVQAVDASGYAHREDRSIIWAGGGTISWNLGTQTFTWTSPIVIHSPIGGRLISIAAGSITDWTDGDVVYVTLTRQPLSNLSATLVKASTLPSNDNAMAFGVRIGGVIYLRTGISLGDGDTSPGVAPVPGGGGGAGGGGGFTLALAYSYVEAATPVEEVTGQTVYDGSLGSSANLLVMLTPSLTLGNCSVKLYDVGAKGVPATPRLVSTLTTSTSGGPQVLEQALAVVSSSPTGNQILNTERMYELTVTSAAQQNDSVFVGSARIEVA